MSRAPVVLFLLSLLACAPTSSWSQPGGRRLSRVGQSVDARPDRGPAAGGSSARGAPGERPATPTTTPTPTAGPEATITAGEIEEHVEVLASDLFEGREAGSKGEQLAAAYLVARLRECARLQPAGDDGTWFHGFELTGSLAGTPSRNVVARLPGTDPALAHELIVVGAHYDHVGYGRNGNSLDGRGEIHNGADDNASGSAALLDLATSLCGAGWAPRRTVLFQWYSGEELGLLGSRAWVADHAELMPDVVFMVNMDMVGRLTGRTLVVGGTGTSPGLSALAQGLCDELGLTMIDDPPGTAPSDNSSFYEQGVPALFLFTGLHEDYHRAGDDSHKVNARGAADVGRLARGLVQAVDARDERPVFTPAPGNAFMFRPTLFTGAVFSEGDGGTPRLAVLLPGSPAESAGLREGDVVLAVDGRATETVDALERALRAVGTELRPLEFSVRREGLAEALTVRVRPTIR